VWVKDRFVLGRSDYHYQHEPILYGWRDDGGHYFVVDRTQSSVLTFARPGRSEEHPTMKPVELYERLIENSSRAGEVVGDPFGGSGTTLIACARTGRVCRTTELDPGYADAIRRRWTLWAEQAGVPPGKGALR
jgi:DNA modification methylase